MDPLKIYLLLRMVVFYCQKKQRSPVEEVGSWTPIIYDGFYRETSNPWLGMGVLKHQQYVFGKVYEATTTWCFERSVGQPAYLDPWGNEHQVDKRKRHRFGPNHSWLVGKKTLYIPRFTRWWFQTFFYVYPFLGKWSNLTVAYFADGCVNHQLDSPNWSWEYTVWIYRMEEKIVDFLPSWKWKWLYLKSN